MTLRRAGSLFALVLLAGSPLFSQLIPLGPDFRVNEADLHATEAPALALDGSGRLLAAWAGPSRGGLNDAENDLLVRAFGRNGEPAGPERVIPAAGDLKAHPALLSLPSGGFAVAWENASPPPPILPPPPGVGDPETLSLRILDKDGAPVGQELRIDKDGGIAQGARLALLPSGQILATWVEFGSQLMARRFDQNGQPASDEAVLAFRDVTVPGALKNDALRGLQDGGFTASWLFDPAAAFASDTRNGWRFTAAGQPTGQPFPLEGEVVALGNDGRFAVLWSEISLGSPPGPDHDIWMDLYDAGGHLVSSALIAGDIADEVVEAAAMDEAGNILVVWSNDIYPGVTERDLTAAFFDRNGVPLGPAFAVASDATGYQLGARVTEKDGEWAISWITREPGSTGGNLFARRFTSCITGGSTLCLGGRFRAQVTWKAPGIGTGTGAGQAVPLTRDTGAFWFFGPENLELVVKAIDGRTLNNHYWVFYGALSNVAYDLTVTDMVTGERKVYTNPAGTMASRADTRAFPGAGGASFAAALAPAEVPRQQTAPLTPPPCVNGPERLCLGGPWQQFQVEVAWKIPGTGQTGTGKAVPLTGETGYFWFFGPENVELIVKILDGQAVNGKYWVFYGALSDVEYTIKVTDKLSGKVKTYHNPAGTMASRADTSAF